MTNKKGPVVVPATLKLNTPSKRLFFVIGASGLLMFALGLLLAIFDRQRISDLQYVLFGIGQWCALVGPLTLIVGLLGSFFYDYTIRPMREAFERLNNWITAG
jgi:hypothetical protein